MEKLARFKMLLKGSSRLITPPPLHPRLCLKNLRLAAGEGLRRGDGFMQLLLALAGPRQSGEEKRNEVDESGTKILGRYY
jgi:hypothetical protein